nr:hypothetical protein [Gemmatimonadaceae bacterium]
GEVLTTLVVHRAIQRSGLPASHLAFLDLPRVERQRSELRRVVRDLLAPRAGTALRPSRPTRIAGTMAVAVSPVPVSADAPAPPVQRLLAPVPAAAARPAPGDLAVPVPLFLDLAAPARTVPSRVAALVAVEHLVADRSSVTAPRVPLRRMDRLATDHRPVAPIAERIDLTAAGLAILGDDFSFGDAHSDDALPRGRATAGPPLSPFARGRIASVDVQLNDTGRALLGDLFD